MLKFRGERVLKEDVRKRIWSLMEKRDIARFPRPVFGRIPNFIGAEFAAERLADLPVFKSAKTVKVNPDSPQRHVREAVLRSGKTLLTPSPRLKRGFLLIKSGAVAQSALRFASTIKGAFQYGKPVELSEIPKVDLVVVGSVAVSLDGARVGKGGGYSEIEYGILRELNAVDEGTPVATTVHEAQIVDSIPLEEHDVPVDLIVTPARVVETKTKHSKPSGIFWEKVALSMIESMPILKELKRNPRQAS
jgi:5-formyltetrahydrofolate cyclo-ligase